MRPTRQPLETDELFERRISEFEATCSSSSDEVRIRKATRSDYEGYLEALNSTSPSPDGYEWCPPQQSILMNIGVHSRIFDVIRVIQRLEAHLATIEGKVDRLMEIVTFAPGGSAFQAARRDFRERATAMAETGKKRKRDDGEEAGAS